MSTQTSTARASGKEQRVEANLSSSDGQGSVCLPAPPIFARGAGSGASVLKETIARQQAIRNTLDLATMFPDHADDEDEGEGGSEGVRPSGSRKSPALARRSPGLRSGGYYRGEPPATKILDFLFLGSVHDAKNVEFLRRNNITQILNVSQEEYYSPDPQNVVVRWFYAEDTCNFDIAKYFPVTEHILQTVRKFYFATKDVQKRERVLVHCQKGRSRSATIVMAHLIRANGWNVAEALQWVSSLREQVEPNLGFIDALREYQEAMTMEERTLLRSRRCLLIRNMIPEGMVLNAKSSRTPHTPLESGPHRTSADGTEFPLLTLDVLKKFFSEAVGMVSDVQVKVKSKEVATNGELADVAEEAEEDENSGENNGGVGLTEGGTSAPGSGGDDKSDAACKDGGPSVDSAEPSTGGSRSVSPSREPTTLSSAFSGPSGDEVGHGCLTINQELPVVNVSTAKKPIDGVATQEPSQPLGLRPQRLSRASFSRSNSGIPQTVVVRSAQILVEFACHENVDVAGILKKTDVNKFLPICPNPTSLLFQKPLSKTTQLRKKKKPMES